MPYEIFYTKSAQRDIRKLDPVAKRRLKKKITFFFNDPVKYAANLIEGKEGDYRWRVGDLRIIFEIQGKRLYITRVGHRREVYEK